jgi:hypothetical protein
MRRSHYFQTTETGGLYSGRTMIRTWYERLMLSGFQSIGKGYSGIFPLFFDNSEEPCVFFDYREYTWVKE